MIKPATSVGVFWINVACFYARRFFFKRRRQVWRVYCARWFTCQCTVTCVRWIQHSIVVLKMKTKTYSLGELRIQAYKKNANFCVALTASASGVCNLRFTLYRISQSQATVFYAHIIIRPSELQNKNATRIIILLWSAVHVRTFFALTFLLRGD